MIKTELLHKLLNADEKDLEKFDIEQLRTMVGVFRYFVRTLEREVNNRCIEKPLGNLTAKDFEQN